AGAASRAGRVAGVHRLPAQVQEPGHRRLVGLTGPGVVVDPTGTKTFLVYGRVAGENRKRGKVKLGIFGQPRDDNRRWTVELARIEARRVLAKLAMGANPNDRLNAADEVTRGLHPP